MSATFDLLTTLANTLRGFNFIEKTLWTLSEHVMVELTFMLKQPENRPTNRQTRAVKKQPPRRKGQSRNNSLHVARHRLHWSLCRCRLLPLPRHCKERSWLPSLLSWNASRLQRNKSDIFEKYDLKKACLHNRHLKMTILQATRKCRPGQTTHDDLPAYFVGVSSSRPMDRQSYILLKGPTSKWHVKRWWNYIDNFCSVTPPISPEDRQSLRTSILWASNKERLFRVFPTENSLEYHQQQEQLRKQQQTQK